MRAPRELRPLVVWRLLDGKPGHERQSEGLVRALAERMPTRVHELRVPARARAWAWWLARGFPPGAGLPDPDLVVGAGHGTHAALLAARRARGGHAVVLMRPTLPLGWFDLCVIPEHDAPPRRPNVLATCGVLNAVRPAPGPRADEGLILVGGPSMHHGWDAGLLLQQVEAVVRREVDITWTLATSRRTPAGFAGEARARLGAHGVAVVEPETVDRGWLPARLARARVAWVSEDSVSMVYEALTAGAAVGLLAVPRRRRSGRVVRGTEGLVARGLAVRHADWLAGAPLRAPGLALDEAGRCADWILARWFGA